MSWMHSTFPYIPHSDYRSGLRGIVKMEGAGERFASEADTIDEAINKNVPPPSVNIVKKNKVLVINQDTINCILLTMFFILIVMQSFILGIMFGGRSIVTAPSTPSVT